MTYPFDQTIIAIHYGHQTIYRAAINHLTIAEMLEWVNMYHGYELIEFQFVNQYYESCEPVGSVHTYNHRGEEVI